VKRQTAKQPRQPKTPHQKSENLNAGRAGTKVLTKKAKGGKRATISPSQPHSKSFGH
jgi:hypothetical protein